jgi:KDO2-lipid IV(A) lauroyltransferase
VSDTPASEDQRQRSGGFAERFLDRLGFWVARLPEPIIYRGADLLAAPIAFYASRHERRVALEGRGIVRNQRIAWRRGFTTERSRSHLQAWARHLAWLLIDVLRMPGLTPTNLERSVDVREYARIRDLVGEGRGVICVTGHIGVWELCSYAGALLGFPVHVVARPLSAPLLERALARVRSGSGQRVIQQQHALLRLVRALRRGETVGLLLDEDESRDPVFAPFLGTEAATNPAAAELQRQTGAPIAVVSCARVGRARYRFRVWRIIRPQPGDDDSERRRVVREMNQGLSEAILDAPSQWLWGARRFHTRPPGERPGPDGLPPAAAPDSPDP